MTNQSLSWFDAAYDGLPPWDIGEPQPEIAALVDAGAVSADVLDAGCGTGEHALLAASRGHAAVGFDASPKAITRARAKAVERGLAVEYVVHDAFELATLGRQFDTVIDCGLMHCFDPAEWPRYTASVASVLRPGGRMHVMTFRLGHAGGGPPGLRREDFAASFAGGWRVDDVREALFKTHVHEGGGEAWLCSLTRL